MSIPDLLNSALISGGSLVCWLNVRRLLRDRKVQGVDWRVTAFFSVWGIWNLVYYPSLHQWASTAAEAALVVANTTWVVLALRMMKSQKRDERIAEVQRERQKWKEHMQHKAYDPKCSFCRRALEAHPIRLVQTLIAHDPELQSLPEIKHTYHCPCELCTDPNTPV